MGCNFFAGIGVGVKLNDVVEITTEEISKIRYNQNTGEPIPYTVKKKVITFKTDFLKWKSGDKTTLQELGYEIDSKDTPKGYSVHSSFEHDPHYIVMTSNKYCLEGDSWEELPSAELFKEWTDKFIEFFGVEPKPIIYSYISC